MAGSKLFLSSVVHNTQVSTHLFIAMCVVSTNTYNWLPIFEAIIGSMLKCASLAGSYMGHL